ncbi:MAG: hypothetical protein QG653_177 [Patescibacteria group bacterium]|nr:hypothetical protein [Patescibacteria group bacterium]
MKTIVIAPIKNEAWILPYTLKNFSDFADHVIVADQKSVDNTKEICSKFEKVTVIDNPYNGYTNEVRFLLLDEARKIPGNNLIVQLDADEFINPDFVLEIKSIIEKEKPSSAIAFSTEWLQLYYDDNSYRIDGVWKNNYKHFAFFDDRIVDYNRNRITNEHINRIPNIKNVRELSLPILHLQSLAVKRCELKQALYMCNELNEGWDPRKTNNRYSVSQFSKTAKTKKLVPEWKKGVDLPDQKTYTTYDETKLKDIFSLFELRGAAFFEPLNIWHIEELSDYFVQETGTKPTKIKTFPSWLIFLNNIKNKVKNSIFKWYTTVNLVIHEKGFKKLRKAQ